MIIEETGRTKRCTDCDTVAHNTIMQSHSCVPIEVVEEFIEKIKKVVKKATKKTKK